MSERLYFSHVVAELLVAADLIREEVQATYPDLEPEQVQSYCLEACVESPREPLNYYQMREVILDYIERKRATL